MTSMHDPDRLIRAFLDEGQTELPARTYDAVRDHIERTRQRVVIGPWREPDMSNIARIAVAAAAVPRGRRRGEPDPAQGRRQRRRAESHAIDLSVVVGVRVAS